MLQCVGLGGVAALLVVMNGTAFAVQPELIGAMLLFFVAILYPQLAVITAVASFLFFGSIILPPDLAFNIFRVAAFTLAIVSTRQLFAPAAVVTLCWVLTLGLSLFGPQAFPFGASVSTANTLGIEIIWSALSWFLLCLPAAGRRFNLPHLSLQQFFVHMLMLPFFAFVCMIFGFALLQGGLSLVELVIMLRLEEAPILFGALSLIFAGILLAAVLGHLLLDIVEQYERAALEPDARPWNLPFLDAALVIERVYEHCLELRELRGLARELLSGSTLEVHDIPAVWAALRRGSQVLAGVPDGVLAVSAQNRLLVATPSVNSLLGLRKGSLIGAESSALRQTDSVWAKDLYNIIVWALSHEAQIQSEGIHRAWTDAEKGVRLEVAVRLWSPRPPSASQAGMPTAEKIFAFYLRVVPDQRAVQETLLLPTSFERIGATSAEIFLGLAENVRSAGEQLSMLTTKFHHSPDAAAKAVAAGGDGSELSQLLVETDKLMRRLTMSVEEQSQKLLSFEDGCEELAMDHFVMRLFGYLHQSLGLEKRIPIRVFGQPVAPGPLPPTQLRACHLPIGESAGLGQYLMWFIRCLLPRTKDLRVNIEQEQIGTGTASLVAGAAPGRYVRVTIENSGQSIPPNVLSSQLDHAPLSQLPTADPLSAALFLLTRQVRRIGGFLTVQSTPAKGTSVGIYLPNDGKPSKRFCKRDIKRLTGTYLRSQSKTATQVLIVGEEKTEHLSGIRSLLERCSLEPVYRSPRELFGELSTPVEFEGRGFTEGDSFTEARNEPREPAQDGDEPRRRFDATPLRLLIFDCDQANYAALSLLDELEKEIPNITKIVLLDEKEVGQLRALPHWVILEKPLNEKDLEEKIRQALRNTAGIHESVLVLEGNDPMSGSGL